MDQSQVVSDWLWHLFNDPMRDNPWSIVALIVIVAAGLAGMFALAVALRKLVRMFGRRKEETGDMSDDQLRGEGAPPARNDDPIAGRDPEGNAPGSASYIETPNQQRERRERQAGESPSPRPRTLADFGTTYEGEPPAQPTANYADDAALRGAPLEQVDLPLTDDTSTRMERAAVAALREPCPHCLGKGYVMTTNDLLRESIALVGDGGDVVVKEFYTRLLAEAPHLAALFPRDLITAASGDELSAGYGQRNRLLGALVALSQSYDTTDPEGMDRLDTALNAYGSRHAAFQRPDGTVSGASLEEYAVVKSVLFGTLVAAAGPAWRDAYTRAWSEAYDYAAGVMLAAQRRSGAAFPRQPRA